MVDKADVCGVEKSHAKDLRRCQAKSVRLFMIHLGKHMAQESKVISSFRRFGSGPPEGNSLAADEKENLSSFANGPPPPLELPGKLLDFPFLRLFLSSLVQALPWGLLLDLIPKLLDFPRSHSFLASW
jgi:hypothetical protein